MDIDRSIFNSDINHSVTFLFHLQRFSFSKCLAERKQSKKWLSRSWIFSERIWKKENECDHVQWPVPLPCHNWQENTCVVFTNHLPHRSPFAILTVFFLRFCRIHFSDKYILNSANKSTDKNHSPFSDISYKKHLLPVDSIHPSRVLHGACHVYLSRAVYEQVWGAHSLKLKSSRASLQVISGACSIGVAHWSDPPYSCSLRVVARPTSSPHLPRRLLSALGTRSRFPHSSHDAPGVLGSGAPAVMGLTAREVDKTRWVQNRSFLRSLISWGAMDDVRTAGFQRVNSCLLIIYTHGARAIIINNRRILV